MTTDERHARWEADAGPLFADVERIANWGDHHPDAFGGHWYDNEAFDAGDGAVRVKVAVVGDPAQLRLLDLEVPDRVDVVAVERSYVDLVQLSEQVADEPDVDGTYVTAVAPDVRTNRVQVSLNRRDPSVEQDLLERYGHERLTIGDPHVPVPA